MVNYCGRWCQGQDWRTHKVFCKYTQTAGVKSSISWQAVLDNESSAPARGLGGHASTLSVMRADLAFQRMLRFFHVRPDAGKTGLMQRYNRELMVQPSVEVAEWIDISWEALMQALEEAKSDNHRMILMERSRRFPPPYAIANEEKKTVVGTSAISGGTEEDQTGPDEVIRHLQGQEERPASTGRRVGGVG
eukprot:g47584.t1